MFKLFLIVAMTLSTLMAATLTHAGVAGIDDEVNAKIARVKSLKAASNSKREKGQDEEGAAIQQLEDGCSIAIGNIFDSGKGGANTSAKRETTVIVTGDVIQAGNDCK
jgi:hypothetical protein